MGQSYFPSDNDMRHRCFFKNLTCNIGTPPPPHLEPQYVGGGGVTTNKLDPDKGANRQHLAKSKVNYRLGLTCVTVHCLVRQSQIPNGIEEALWLCAGNSLEGNPIKKSL